MERDGDLLLNVSCSHQTHEDKPGSARLPQRMPDGTRIDKSRTLIKKMIKTHHPATSSGTVFIPRHKLPVLDEFGLTTPSDHVGYDKPPRMLPLRSSLAESESSADRRKASQSTITATTTHDEQQTHTNRYQHQNSNGTVAPRVMNGMNQSSNSVKPILKNNHVTSDANETATKEVDASSRKAKRRKRKKKEQEPMIIPKEVRAVAGGLPPSFPQYRIKKFTEEYQMKKRKELEEGETGENDEAAKKKRRSFVPGLNPRKREKAPSLFDEFTLHDLEDLHPYLVQNLEQNFNIKNLTKVQKLAMPHLLKMRFDNKRHDVIINSGIGTGKILSYAAPIVNNLALMEPKIDRTKGIYALVLLPTRELAAKISEIFSSLCRSFLWIVPGLLTGGERKKSEKARIRKGLNILITTPGRLIDHMDHSTKMDFSKMRYCVMADAHRLLDPERAEVSKNIAILLRKRLPYNCVRCVVTATMTKKLEKLTEIFVDKPHVIDAFKEFE
uniref:ATP-dependent RNA helicase n=1 Tax=Aceria tosichella TaxID=561515 RepID=A0A6G1SDX2_9ACAR